MSVSPFGMTSLSQGKDTTPCSSVVPSGKGLTPLSFVRKNFQTKNIVTPLVVYQQGVMYVTFFRLTLLSQGTNSSPHPLIVASGQGLTLLSLVEKNSYKELHKSFSRILTRGWHALHIKARPCSP